MKLQLTGFAEGSDIVARKRKCKDDTKVFALRNWNVELPLIVIKKTVEESGCEVGENNQEFVC